MPGTVEDNGNTEENKSEPLPLGSSRSNRETYQPKLQFKGQCLEGHASGPMRQSDEGPGATALLVAHQVLWVFCERVTNLESYP